MIPSAGGVAQQAGIGTLGPLLKVHGCGLMEIASLPSFVSLHKNVNDGEEQVVTKDLLSSPGYAILIHHDGAQVAADSKRIHELCKDGLFEDF